MTRTRLFPLVFVLFTMTGFAQNGIITTYVGPGLPVDGTPAINQYINCTSLALNGADGLYVSSSFQNRIYWVKADGNLTALAGTGSAGFSGDGGPAAAARLNGPSGLAVDAAGNLYVADTRNHRIRKITPKGMIMTVAGDGTAGSGGDGGLAISAQLNYPVAIAVDGAGTLYIGDQSDRVRKVTAAGVIGTVAGTGVAGYSGDGGAAAGAQLNYPCALAFDAAGNLYIADSGNNRIRIVTPDGLINTYAGTGVPGYSGDGGQATSAQLQGPHGIGFDAAGTLYFSDTKNYRIRKVTKDGIISFIAGNGTGGYDGDGSPAAKAWILPTDIAVVGPGTYYFVSGEIIRKITSDGIINVAVGKRVEGFNGDGLPLSSTQLNSPQGIALDRNSNLYISDSLNHRIRKVTPAGEVSTFAGNGNPGLSGDDGRTISEIAFPQGIAFGPDSNLYIADSDNHRVRKVTPGGIINTVAGMGDGNGGGWGFSGDGGPATLAKLHGPGGVALDRAGNLYIADTQGFRVRRVTTDGIISTVAGNGNIGFSGDGGPATSAQIGLVYGMALDSAGNLYIGDCTNRRIRMVTPSGVISTVAGGGNDSGEGVLGTSAKLGGPYGLMLDSAGNLYFTDITTRVRVMTPAGVIYTVAGISISGFSGDGGRELDAQLYYPEAVALDNAGNLYICDSQNHRIRKVSNVSIVPMNLNAAGSATASTSGVNGTTQTGYATVTIDSGTTPYGTAVFSFMQNEVTVGEAAVPASPPTTAARIFIDYRSSVAAIPGRISAGAVNVDTGIAAVDCSSAPANITYTLRNMTGATLSIGHGTLAAGAHFATFIDQLNQVAPDFALPADFQTAIQFASLEIDSDQPLSLVALRMTTNQRNDVLFTATPTADLTKPATNTSTFFPQFADGGGYTTSLFLLNTSNAVEAGTVQLLNDKGNPLVVNQVGSTVGSIFRYSIPSGGVARFQSDGSPANIGVGWAQVIPDAGTSTPIGAGVFGYNPETYLVTESGIPAAVSTTHACIYVDLSGGHDTGLAVANPTNNDATISITAYESDGVTPIGTSQGPLPLPANGHDAFFADGFIAGLPAEFTGVLDIASSTPFAALTVRSLTNERSDFLLATFPIADMTVGAPSPIVFPQIADGGGYVTQFILIGAGGASSVTLNYYGNGGSYLPIGK